ncbi:SNF2-related protein [Thermofilum pendens]|uniref:Helicase domain protein n=1 Tax=Thermofilum pendens (strain DSM 2475 / Hrk 5) TaxID=368408 RepID=A1RYV5_THEPD|nr:SNF2-related protein [Thermofilum pendens]ABL78385.1 helicase domain protein [Thermofilum pendens Hrk 5]
MVSLIEILRSAGKDLYKHQLDFVSDALWFDEPRILLADDVGLGKTIQALLYIKALLELGRVNHVLVIVPRAVVEQWASELEMFEIPFYIVESPDFPLGHRVYLVTLDRAKVDSYMEALDKINWDLVVVDEAHKLRLETLRSKVAILCRRARGCLLLTATPHTGDESSFKFLIGLANSYVVRREKKDVEEYEGRKIFPSLGYWIVQVKATKEESDALHKVLKFLENDQIEQIVRVVVEKRAMSSPTAFFKTLGKVVGGYCSEELLEEGELDACIGNVAGVKKLEELAKKYASAADRKLDALEKLLKDHLKGRKVLVFTEYATTAEYLFEKLVEKLEGCKIVDSGEGYAKADCSEFGVMYVTAKARDRIDVSREGALLASAYPTAVLISTDIMSEGVNLQAFDVVVNYEVVWSPTKHVQRIGRIWRFGQKAEKILVIDMVLKTTLSQDEYSNYLTLLEKLYEISLAALPPQSYGEFEIYEVDQELRKIVEIGSSAYLGEEEVYEALRSGRLEDLRSRIKRILKAKENMRWKSRNEVDEGLRVKLGYPPEKKPEPGGGYYVANVTFERNGVKLYSERILLRLPTPLSRSRSVQEGVFRELEVPWDAVVEDTGSLKEDEREEVNRMVWIEVWHPLQQYLSRNNLPEGGINVEVKRARVESIGVAELIPVTLSFEELVEREVRYSRNRERTERAAARCIRSLLENLGYTIVEEYASIPRPFDMVVKKDGILYTVEVKGKWVGKRDEPLSFTANEIDWASRFPDRHIVCIAYVDRDYCEDVECYYFNEFQKKWVLETVRGIEYKYNARKKKGADKTEPQ